MGFAGVAVVRAMPSPRLQSQFPHRVLLLLMRNICLVDFSRERRKESDEQSKSECLPVSRTHGYPRLSLNCVIELEVPITSINPPIHFEAAFGGETESWECEVVSFWRVEITNRIQISASRLRASKFPHESAILGSVAPDGIS